MAPLGRFQEAMAQEFVRAAARGEIEVSQLAVMNPDIWARVQEIEREQNPLQRVTDSAGITCEYTPIEELQPGDVVIIGWRTTVGSVEIEVDRARVIWEEYPHPDQWNPLGTPMPVEVTS